jgi:hypothetical protein
MDSNNPVRCLWGGRQTSHREYFSNPFNSFIYFLDEEDTIFSKSEMPKKSELFSESLRYGHI